MVGLVFIITSNNLCKYYWQYGVMNVAHMARVVGSQLYIWCKYWERNMCWSSVVGWQINFAKLQKDCAIDMEVVRSSFVSAGRCAWLCMIIGCQGEFRWEWVHALHHLGQWPVTHWPCSSVWWALDGLSCKWSSVQWLAVPVQCYIA